MTLSMSGRSQTAIDISVFDIGMYDPPAPQEFLWNSEQIYRSNTCTPFQDRSCMKLA